MILPGLHDVQLRMLRTCVRNAMFFATLPFYLAQETHPVPARSRRTGQTSSAPQDGRVCGSEDMRWLR
jgi:hypothetical protein